MKEFAERLKIVQQTRHITQYELARQLGISPGTLSAYLNDKNNPQIHEVARFAQTLGVSVGWLCGEDPADPAEVFAHGALSYADVVAVLDALLSLPRPGSPARRSLFEAEIGPYEGTLDESLTLCTPDRTVVQYYKTMLKVRELYEDGTLDHKTYQDILTSKRKALADERFRPEQA